MKNELNWEGNDPGSLEVLFRNFSGDAEVNQEKPVRIAVFRQRFEPITSRMRV
jgi:hypothetical protein